MMKTNEIPLSKLLEFAIGNPENGCCNLHLLKVCLVKIIGALRIQNLPVSAKEMGFPEDFDFVRIKDKEIKNRTNEMWSMMKMKKEVETSLEGVNRLFEMFSDIINGDTNVVTWGRLDEHLHVGEEKTHEELAKTLRDLKDAKEFFGDDADKMREIEKKEEDILERKERFMEQDRRASRRSIRDPTRMSLYKDFSDEDDDEDRRATTFSTPRVASELSSTHPTKGLFKKEGEEKEKRGITIASPRESEASPQPPPSSGRQSTRASTAPRPSSRASSMGYDEGTTEAQKTLAGLGQMALLAGGLEERINVQNAQIKLLMKFRNAMVQGDVVAGLVKLLSGDGLEFLKRLLDQERAEGGLERIKEAINDLKNLMMTNQEEVNDNIAGIKTDLEELTQNHNTLKSEILRQQNLTKDLTKLVNDLSREIMILKDQVSHLEQVKADRYWTIAELNNKMNLALLPSLVRREEFQENLRAMGENLSELLDKLMADEDLLQRHIQETFDAVNQRLPIRAFEEFRQTWTSRLEKIQSMLFEILGVTNGEEEGAFLKLLKFHCAACDRPLRTVKQANAPTLPVLQGFNASKSARAVSTFGHSQIRRNIRNNNAYDNSAKTTTTTTTTTTTEATLHPSFGANVRGYNEAVEDRRKIWEDRRRRVVKTTDDPLLIDRNQIKQMNASSYLQSTPTGGVQDVWQQERKDGGVHTVTRASQRVLRLVDRSRDIEGTTGGGRGRERERARERRSGGKMRESVGRRESGEGERESREGERESREGERESQEGERESQEGERQSERPSTKSFEILDFPPEFLCYDNNDDDDNNNNSTADSIKRKIPKGYF